MPVKRRLPKHRATVSATAWKILTDQPPTAEDDRGERFVLNPNNWHGPHIGVGTSLADLWNDHRDEILADWIEEAPGTRPLCWWRFDAPRQPVGTWPGTYYDGKVAALRQRLGGIGTPNYEALAYVPAFVKGIPCGWVRDWDVAYYNGRALDVHGEPIGTEYADGDFPYHAIDPKDPPLFESEAGYLDRHGLLAAGERRRLTAEDFEPVTVVDLDASKPEL